MNETKTAGDRSREPEVRSQEVLTRTWSVGCGPEIHHKDTEGTKGMSQESRDRSQEPRAGSHESAVSAAAAQGAAESIVAGEQRHQLAGKDAGAPSRRGLWLALGAAVAAGLITYGGYHWWSVARLWVKTDNAYVAGHIHQVSSRVAGTVREVFVRDNEMVSAGALLAQLDKGDFEVRREQAQAQLTQARAQRRQAEAQVAQARAQIAREQANATKTKRDLERARTLHEGSAGAISKQEFDAALAAAEAAQAGLQAAESALESARSLATAAEAQEQVALANVKDAELQLGYTEIVAPAGGRIGKKNIEIGNRVQPGQALLALVQPEVWLVANFKETQLADLRPGQAARIHLDSFPGRVLTGRVESLAPASGAQFALLPPDNAIGNFTRIVQRVPVKIVLDDPSAAGCEGRIVPGMSAIAEVKVSE